MSQDGQKNDFTDVESRTGPVAREKTRQTDIPGRYRQRRADAELGREATHDDGSVELPQRKPWQEESVRHEKLYISDSDDSTVDENFEVESLADSIPDQLSWRGRLQTGLHSHWFHLAIVFLVGLDAFIVLFELLLDVGAFNNIECRGETFIEQAEFCHYSESARGFCRPHAELLLKGINISESPGEGVGNEDLCECVFRGGKLVCGLESESKGVDPSLFLHATSIAILTIFVLEVAVKLIAFRLKYFTHKFEVFDGIVVMVSWILDIASLKEEAAFEAASLLIILRLWRVVRIVNGAVLSAKSQSDNQLHEARLHARSIIHAFHKCQTKLESSTKDNARLRRVLEQAGIKIPESRDGAGSRHRSSEGEPLILASLGREEQHQLPRKLDHYTPSSASPLSEKLLRDDPPPEPATTSDPHGHSKPIQEDPTEIATKEDSGGAQEGEKEKEETTAC